MAVYKGSAAEGDRARQLQKERAERAEALAMQQKRLEDETSRKMNIQGKFSATNDDVETNIRLNTYGLVTLDEMKAAQQAAEEHRAKKLAAASLAKSAPAAHDGRPAAKAKKPAATLSFDLEEEDAAAAGGGGESAEASTEPSASASETPAAKRARLGKNPDVDTSFLPDREREEQELKRREELRREWVAKQETMKKEAIEITYSYWDGSGNRRKVAVTKGNTIYEFLQACLKQLRSEFPELRAVTAEQLMYVKEDIILPSNISFYDLITSKARGKSGPLFNFDVHDDVRLQMDATLEKDESHAGKVCLRSWYNSNKHIFPASRWENYDPEKVYTQYTIKDVKKDKK